jgi:SEC-C motif
MPICIDVTEIQAVVRADERRAQKLWTNQNVYQMVSWVRTHADVDHAVLDRAFGVGYQLQNIFVHNSPASVGSVVTARSPRTQVVAGQGSFLLSRQPSRLLVQDAPSLAYHSLAMMARLLCQAGSSGALDALLETDMPRFVYLTNAEMRRGRNDPCPCGSGRKFKLSHGERG